MGGMEVPKIAYDVIITNLGLLNINTKNATRKLLIQYMTVSCLLSAMDGREDEGLGNRGVSYVYACVNVYV